MQKWMLTDEQQETAKDQIRAKLILYAKVNQMLSQTDNINPYTRIALLSSQKL